MFLRSAKDLNRLGKLFRFSVEIREYMVDGVSYWIVTGWRKHQRIDRPTYRHPLPQSELKTVVENSMSAPREIDESSSNNPRLLAESSATDRKGREGNGKEEDIVISQTQKPSKSNCPHEEIIALYNAELPICPPVRSWNNTRKGYLKQRWLQDPKHQTLDFWKEFFKFVRDSRFLTGQVSGRNDQPPFVADLEWLVKPNNFAKISKANIIGKT